MHRTTASAALEAYTEEQGKSYRRYTVSVCVFVQLKNTHMKLTRH